MVLQIVRAEERATEDVGYGPLRSVVDVTLPPGEGISTHHHRNVEVITVVLAGEMTHKDARDEVTLIPAGSAHRLSAGIGVTHAEYNLGEAPARFVQIVIEAEIRGVRPEGGLLDLSGEGRAGELLPIASGDDLAGALPLYQDATIYRARLEEAAGATAIPEGGRGISWTAEVDRLGYLYVYEGSAEIDGTPARAGEAALIPSGATVTVWAKEPAGLVVIDLPA